MSGARDQALALIADAVTRPRREMARLRIGVVTQLENTGNRRVRLDITGNAWLGYSRDVGLMVGDRAIAIQQRAVTVVIGRLTGVVVGPGGLTEEDDDLADIQALSPIDGDMLRYVAGSWTNQTVDQIITAMGLGMADVAGLIDFFNDYDSHAGDAAAHGGLKQPLDSDLTAIAAISPANDDMIQRKSGVWVKRTIAEVRADLLIPSDTITALAGKQPIDSDLTTIAAIAPSNDDVIQRKGGLWVARTMAQVKADLLLVKADVGLSLVPNIDATARSSHSGTQTAATISDFSAAADARITAQKGVALGLATLDASGFVPAAQLPSFVDDIFEAASTLGFPLTGSSGTIYLATGTGKIYRWSGSVYVEISPSPGSTDSVTEGSTNLYYTNARADARIAAALGISVQAYHANLAALAGLTGVADRIPYFTGAGAMALQTAPSFGRSIIAASSQAAARIVLALTPGTNVQAQSALLQALAGLTTAADLGIYATGANTFATYALGSRARTFLAATSTALQRTDLGLVIGTDVQAYSAALAQIAGLNSAANDDILQRKGGAWVTRTLAQYRTDLLIPADTITDLSNKQPLSTNLTQIAAVIGSNDDMLQKKGGVWVTRTPAQVKTDLALVASDVGLGSVPNVDATLRSNHSGSQVAATISDFTAAADARVTAGIAAVAGIASGLATLDGAGLVPSSQLPSFVDDVLEYANLGSFPGTGTTGKIYVALDTSKVYRWGGSAYTEIIASPGTTDAVTEGAVNLYHTNARVNALIAAAVGATVQGYSVRLSEITAIALPGDGDVLQFNSGVLYARSLSGQRTDLNLPANTVTDLAGKQPLHANLTHLASVSVTDSIPYKTGLGWANVISTSLGRSLMAVGSAQSGRALLVVGQALAASIASDTYTITLTLDPIQVATLTNWNAGTKTITTSGSKSEGDLLRVVIGFNASASRTIVWNAIFVAGSGLTLPAASVIGKKQWADFVWDDTDSKLVMVRLVTRA